MKIHLNQIPTEGRHFEGTDPSKILDLREESNVRPVSDIQYSLDVGLSDGGLFATGQLGVDLDLQCVGCLERFQYPLRVPGFACQIELTGSEMVDLTEPVREDILLALPPHPHCDWNGKRVCPGVSYRSKTEVADAPLAEKPDAWGALDQLKLK
ncbi:hypothetical protein CfE428DRAFT_3892 [Chthoniobacter flavus Ellin428]|uniref:DUF177 domain-containing protein n=1 Tax=Chthoniobacter flavus Ellin428 TaxID=497964 RepID=B4D4Q4_9BACT|nr:hypothetical protein [Chthoniobacter flavus]EDY18507.1 hypothetical protein CfE428DRAFT_3892 [Chthoniobacter flavus Ellin428]TCO91032.1 uncharacterized protein EV701_109185 [Chthoniobacter flavus]